MVIVKSVCRALTLWMAMSAGGNQVRLVVKSGHSRTAVQLLTVPVGADYVRITNLNEEVGPTGTRI